MLFLKQITGYARNNTRRQDSSKEILEFRVETFDENGNTAEIYPVELRGPRISGTLQEGDKVQVTGRKTRYGIKARGIRNISSNHKIGVRGIPKSTIIIWKLSFGAIILGPVLYNLGFENFLILLLVGIFGALLSSLVFLRRIIMLPDIIIFTMLVSLSFLFFLVIELVSLESQVPVKVLGDAATVINQEVKTNQFVYIKQIGVHLFWISGLIAAIMINIGSIQRRRDIS